MGASREKALNGLTLQEEKMCQLYVHGGKAIAGNQSAAYQAAYNWTGKDTSLWTKASTKFAEPHIKDRIRELVSDWDEHWVKARLAALAEDSDRDSDKIRATELMGKTHALFIDKNETHVDIVALELEDDDIEETEAS